MTHVSPLSSRLVDLRFDLRGASLWSALYRAGRPIQYSYLCAPLALWQVQTAYGARPWSVEMPSAGRPLSVSLLRTLRSRGTSWASVTHAAGLSSTGDPALDAALPLPERYEIPEETAVAIARTREGGCRVIAVGTTVVRALEASALANHGSVRAGTGVTDLRITRSFRLQIVDGLVTGIHESGTSHFELATSFASRDFMDAAVWHAEAVGYLTHEFGDSSLILPS